MDIEAIQRYPGQLFDTVLQAIGKAGADGPGWRHTGSRRSALRCRQACSAPLKSAAGIVVIAHCHQAGAVVMRYARLLRKAVLCNKLRQRR